MLTANPTLTSIPGSTVPIAFGRGQLNHLGQLAQSLSTKKLSQIRAATVRERPEGIETSGKNTYPSCGSNENDPFEIVSKDSALSNVLLVTDPGILAAGHVDRAAKSLTNAGLPVTVFSGVHENPTTHHVNAGLAVARRHPVDLIIALGGGSAMDCAKGINFLLTNGGSMQDYRGLNKAAKPMLPLIAIPTTAGTGSEAQSFALITDPETHEKMACGDPKALPRLAILDPDLLKTCPPRVAAATGIDALSHALETSASTKRTDTSRRLSKQAFDLLTNSLPAIFSNSPIPNSAISNSAISNFKSEIPNSAISNSEISNFKSEIQIVNPKSKIENALLGAHLAGAAIQNSMLGATHACANPLTAKFNIVHGLAIALMLPHVIRFNTQFTNPYSDLDPNPSHLLHRLHELLALANIPLRLQHYGITAADLPNLAAAAALQWTASFNPRPVSQSDLLEIYQLAWNAGESS